MNADKLTERGKIKLKVPERFNNKEHLRDLTAQYSVQSCWVIAIGVVSKVVNAVIIAMAVMSIFVMLG